MILQNEWILPILLVISVLVCCLIAGWTGEAVLQGILCAMVATYGHQVAKQGNKALTKNAEEIFESKKPDPG